MTDVRKLKNHVAVNVEDLWNWQRAITDETGLDDAGRDISAMLQDADLRVDLIVYETPVLSATQSSSAAHRE